MLMIKQLTLEERIEMRLALYQDLVPEIYSANAFPSDFSLTPLDWALSPEVVNRPDIPVVTEDQGIQIIRPIGSLDVEFLSNDIVALAKKREVDLTTNYPCGLKCPGCFSEEDIYGDADNLMTWQEMMGVIDQAREIGVHSIKFLGPGELFQNPDLFDILDAIEERGLPFSVFTKGAELGDNELAEQMYGHLGITTAEELVARIAEYKTLRILLGFNSLLPERQDKMVGSYSATANYIVEDGKFVNRGVVDYTEKRDEALFNLIEAGFNDPEKGQRLSLIAAPVYLSQIDEIPSMYAWAAERNIPLLVVPTMESGPKAQKLTRSVRHKDPSYEKLINLFVTVYESAVTNGIMTYDQIKKQGISAYAGTDPCNQVANGLYVRLNGQVKICPGSSQAKHIYGNIHDTSLVELWTQSPNYRLGRLHNNWCPGKSKGLPNYVQEEVMKRLAEKYEI